MKVAAIGDAHLGRSYYSKVSESGVNLRELDFEESFQRVVDAALLAEPELVIFLGDIFDHPRPSYRSFLVAQRAIRQIREHGVDLAVISGNHDTPRLPGRGSPYASLAESFTGARFAFQMEYERFEFADLVVHAVPQALDSRASKEQLSAARAAFEPDRTNLLITHPRLAELEPSHSDINEIEIESADLAGSDLVLLGHYHFFSQLGDSKIWYAGSTDTFSFADSPGLAKGFALLDTDTGRCEHVGVEGRRDLETFGPIEASGMGPSELTDALCRVLEQCRNGSVVRVFLEGVDHASYSLYDSRAVRALADSMGLVNVSLQPQFSGAAMVQERLPELESISQRWAGYVNEQVAENDLREEVLSLGRTYIQNAIENPND